MADQSDEDLSGSEKELIRKTRPDNRFYRTIADADADSEAELGPVDILRNHGDAVKLINATQPVLDAARNLLLEISEHGTHQNWKTLENAMRKIGAWDFGETLARQPGDPHFDGAQANEAYQRGDPLARHCKGCGKLIHRRSE